MDKYTVDLDKVLNDFEYNELTEQSNGYAGGGGGAVTQPQYTYPTSAQFTYGSILPTEAAPSSYPKLPLGTTKHSINNVFHSLNEYLNSDIKNTATNSVDEEDDVVSEPEPEPPLLRRSTSNDTTTIQQIFNNLTKDNAKQIFQEVNNSTNVPENKPDPVEKQIEQVSLLLPTSSPSQNIQEEPTHSPTIIQHEKEPEIQITQTVGEEEKQQEDNDDEREIEEHVQGKQKEILVEEETVEVSESNAEPSVSPEIVEHLKPVGFEEITDLSDTEMNKELELLEAELADEQDIDVVQQNVENIHDEKDLKSELEEANQIPSLSSSSSTSSGDHHDIMETSTEEEKEAVEQQDVEETVACEALQLNTIRHEEVPEQVLEQQQQQHTDDVVTVEEEEAASVPPPNEPTVVEEATPDSLEQRRLVRPNSLDLNSDTTASDNLTIDLIGAPGSTPYNNVYIQNNLEAEVKEVDKDGTEPELNNSLSPTLSDASTLDNSDSANTSDSCNDTSLDEYCEDRSAARSSMDKQGNADHGSATENNAETHNNAPTSTTLATTNTTTTSTTTASTTQGSGVQLGQTAPFWIPDSETQACQQCGQRFTVIRRRHHCRACGLVLCAACCHHKYPVPYLGGQEARVCLRCLQVLQQLADTPATANNATTANTTTTTASGSPQSKGAPHSSSGSANSSPEGGGGVTQPPQPAGVLKRTGSAKSRHSKSVTFCDGVRPGHDDNPTSTGWRTTTTTTTTTTARPPNTHDQHYIPTAPDLLPPLVNNNNTTSGGNHHTLTDVCGDSGDGAPPPDLMQVMRESEVKFALRRNLFVRARIINMDCCINKTAWCFASEGMIAVGQDEIVILLEVMETERQVPKDIFYHLDNIYMDALKGTSISEMGLSIHNTGNFLGSKNHVGFVFIKPTFQCMQKVLVPKEPYLIGILIHRWETPWAKMFPLRLVLRLGAEYRYYPSPIISTRHRESVYVEIGHTIVNLLADFRNFSYTMPAVRGLTIHMEGPTTTVSIPSNRYDQVIKALNNSSEHILAFAANFSPKADSHLVCIQDTHGNNENSYTTHAINIHNRPRKVTGASFIVLNGALKSSSGLTAKSSIIEDGLMIQILPEQMVKLRNSLRNMKDFQINCGCVNAQSDECVYIVWGENDVNFNVGVTSPIDGMSLSGVPSIRVHNGKDYVCNGGTKLIRWTEVFIIQSGEECTRSQDPVDVSKVSESIAKATAQALVKYLELLAANNFLKIGIRSTLHLDNVSFLAGSNNTRLPPIYMKSLDNELVPLLHNTVTAAVNSFDSPVVLELVFHVLNA